MFRKTYAPSLAALALLGIAALPAAAADLYVDNAYDSGPGSLRQAIADANPAGGDTVRFVDGYSANIVLTSGEIAIDKDLTIVGPGPGDLQISGNNLSRIFSITPGHTMFLSGAQIFAGSVVGGSGGAIANAGNLTLQNCWFFSNSAIGGSGQGGGALYSALGSRLVLDGCQFDSNTASALSPTDRLVFGGAVYARGALNVQNCLFTFNRSDAYRGGAIAVDGDATDPTVTIVNTQFEVNTAAQDGGAIDNEGRTLDVARCTFLTNFASGARSSSGGAIYNIYGVLSLTNSVFANNLAQGSSSAGGAVYSYGAARAINCTFASNNADGQGGAFAGFYDTNQRLDNCIFWNNYAPVGRQVTVQSFGIPGYDAGQITVANSDVQDGVAGLNGVVDGGGNIDADPRFVLDPSVANPADLHLLPDSPCVDAGNDGALPEGVVTDRDGNARIVGSAVDLGAYETNVADTTAPTLTWGAPSPAANARGWNNTAVTIAFTTADNLSGVASVSTPGPLSFTAEGAGQSQSVTVTDRAGNRATYTSPIVNIDLTAPTSAASVAGSSVTLSATDSLSGVQATYYRVNGGAQQTYTGPFTLPVGLNTVQYWSVDAADNVETVRSVSVDTRNAVKVSVASVSGRKGRSVSLTATVTQATGGALLAGKTVTFQVNGVFVGNAVTSKRGVATISYTIPTGLALGSYPIVAVSQADGTHKSGSGTGTLTVK